MGLHMGLRGLESEARLLTGYRCDGNPRCLLPGAVDKLTTGHHYRDPAAGPTGHRHAPLTHRTGKGGFCQGTEPCIFPFGEG